MGDDIVTRLREMATDGSRHSTHYDGCVWVHPLCGLSWALDEVELLRTAGDALHAAIRNHDLREEHIKAWEEARRD